jgi:hypothetical protein
MPLQLVGRFGIDCELSHKLAGTDLLQLDDDMACSQQAWYKLFQQLATVLQTWGRLYKKVIKVNYS